MIIQRDCVFWGIHNRHSCSLLLWKFRSLKNVASKLIWPLKKFWEKGHLRSRCNEITCWGNECHKQSIYNMKSTATSFCLTPSQLNSLKSDLQFHCVTSRGRALPKFPHGARWHQRWSVLVRVDAACATTRRFLSILWVEGKRSTEPILVCF